MKRKALMGILLGALCFGIMGCNTKNYDLHSKLIQIEGENDLYYYSNTHIVYILFNEDEGVYFGYGYMSPYYSKNGKLCTYDVEKKQIIELGE